MNAGTCVVCGGTGVDIIARGLNIKKCGTCGLLWLVGGSEDRTHYEEKDAGAKTVARLRNARAQVAYAAQYTSLDYTCDVGCGDGTLLIALKEAGYSNCVGLEPSVRARDLGLSHGASIESGGLECLPEIVVNHKIHNVTMMHVLEHLEEPKRALEAIYAALPPGGFLVVETPNSEAHIIVQAQYEHDLVYPEHLFLFSPQSLRRVLTDTGFVVCGSGVRDFDDHSLSITQSLVRLGLRPYTPIKERMGAKKSIAEMPPAPSSVMRDIVRYLLNQAVLSMGRVDYQWVVAQKPLR